MEGVEKMEYKGREIKKINRWHNSQYKTRDWLKYYEFRKTD
jgi:hypothetical protein